MVAVLKMMMLLQRDGALDVSTRWSLAGNAKVMILLSELWTVVVADGREQAVKDAAWVVACSWWQPDWGAQTRR